VDFNADGEALKPNVSLLLKEIRLICVNIFETRSVQILGIGAERMDVSELRSVDKLWIIGQHGNIFS
jgi:hypothetical protein